MSPTESVDDQIAAEIRESIDTIEEAYEFMLAYAAQGRQIESESEGASQIRGFLERFREALNMLSSHAAGLLETGKNNNAFSAHFTRDTEVMMDVLDMLTSKSNITSDMIDNTNGMIAVRSFLTNVFFIDQVVLPSREVSSAN